VNTACQGPFGDQGDRRRAVEAPMRWIATNAMNAQKVKESKDTNYGYNAATDVYEDLVKGLRWGFVRNALQNAASIASLLLTTEAMVADIPEPKGEAPAGGGGGGMGGMY